MAETKKEQKEHVQTPETKSRKNRLIEKIEMETVLQPPNDGNEILEADSSNSEKTQTDEAGEGENSNIESNNINIAVLSTTETPDKGKTNIESGQKTETTETTKDESGTNATEKPEIPTDEITDDGKKKRGTYKKRAKVNPDTLTEGVIPPKNIDEPPPQIKKDKITITVSGHLMLVMIDMICPATVLKIAQYLNVKPTGMRADDLRLTVDEKKEIEPIAAEVAKMIFTEMNPLTALIVLLGLTYSGKIMTFEGGKQ